MCASAFDGHDTSDGRSGSSLDRPWSCRPKGRSGLPCSLTSRTVHSPRRGQRCRCDPMPMRNDVSGECEEIEVQWCNDGNKNPRIHHYVPTPVDLCATMPPMLPGRQGKHSSCLILSFYFCPSTYGSLSSTSAPSHHANLPPGRAAQRLHHRPALGLCYR
jgi:hypothetical protein